MIGESATVADAWRRSKLRHAWLVVTLTIALTAGAAWFFTLPSWWKIQASQWPSAAAQVEDTSQGPTDGREWIFEGSRVKIRFSYTPSDGRARESTQQVSLGWARSQGIGQYGFVMPADLASRDRPWERIVCFYDPRVPDRAVLERSIGHADVPALMPLVVLLFGGLMFAAERRNAERANDVATRTASRNGSRWRTNVYRGAMSSTAFESPSVDASMLVTALINWPAVAVHVSPHPPRLGGPCEVTLSFASRRRWRRRLRVRLMLGRFNTSGRASNARWSADVFDGTLAPDETIREVVGLPRAGDLPAGVDDCWLRITARTTFGLPWSRTLWIALDDDEKSVTFSARSV